MAPLGFNQVSCCGLGNCELKPSLQTQDWSLFLLDPAVNGCRLTARQAASCCWTRTTMPFPNQYNCLFQDTCLINFIFTRIVAVSLNEVSYNCYYERVSLRRNCGMTRNTLFLILIRIYRILEYNIRQGQNGPSSPGFSLRKELLCVLSEVACDIQHLWPQMSHLSSAMLLLATTLH